jgi:Fe-Mn family superoxide dismutase
MAFELPKLPYEYNALEPHIDEQTMRIHHTKHHQAYTDKLNAAIAGKKELEKKTIEELLTKLDKVPKETRTAVQNHGGGYYNHNLFWEVMAPNAGGEPSGELHTAIDKTFGSFEAFKKQFSDAALGIFGSGWGWLVLDKGKLKITTTPNQNTPISVGQKPLLGIDMWEHAFYLKVANRKAEYVASWWNVVNWKKTEALYKIALD